MVDLLMLALDANFCIGILLGGMVTALLLLFVQHPSALITSGPRWASQLNLQWSAMPTPKKTISGLDLAAFANTQQVQGEKHHLRVERSLDPPAVQYYAGFPGELIRRRTLLLRLKIFSRLLRDPLVIHNPARYYETLHVIETIQTDLMLLESRAETAPVVEKPHP